jgi:hypothetical protein
MGEYEPRDSRNVTLKQERAPGEPPRTGPQEAATRQQEGQADEAEQGELMEDGRGEDAEQTAALDRDEDEEAGSLDRND